MRRFRSSPRNGARMHGVRRPITLSGEPKPPPAWAAPLRGYPADSSGPGYRHSAALDRCQRSLLGWRIRILVGLAEAIAPEQEDLAVFDETVGDGRRDDRNEEDVAPVGERSVGSDDCGPLLAVAGGDDLIEEVRRLLVESQIPELITNQESGFGIRFELAKEGVIDL